MLSRQEEAMKKQTLKLEKTKQELLDAEQKEKELRRKALLDHLNKPVPKQTATWKELEEQQNQRRKERAERHKAELLLSVANKSIKGTATTDTIKEKILLLQKENMEREEQARKFVAKDPNKVFLGAQVLDAITIAHYFHRYRNSWKQQDMRMN